MSEAIEFAKVMADSDFVPADYRGKSGNIMAAVQMGAEIGLAPMQALQNIAVINGRPSVWGDAALALVRGSSVCDYVNEMDAKEIEAAGWVAECKAQRKGDPHPIVRTFSKDDAIKAGLWGRKGPWTTYPARMLQMRARGFCLRDGFPDVLKGLITAEEAQDIQPPKDVEHTVSEPSSSQFERPVEQGVEAARNVFGGKVIDVPENEPQNEPEGPPNEDREYSVTDENEAPPEPTEAPSEPSSSPSSGSKNMLDFGATPVGKKITANQIESLGRVAKGFKLTGKHRDYILDAFGFLSKEDIDMGCYQHIRILCTIPGPLWKKVIEMKVPVIAIWEHITPFVEETQNGKYTNLDMSDQGRDAVRELLKDD
jgi:hypothetical protein